MAVEGCHMLGLLARGVWDELAILAALELPVLPSITMWKNSLGSQAGWEVRGPLHFHLSAHSIV